MSYGRLFPEARIPLPNDPEVIIHRQRIEIATLRDALKTALAQWETYADTPRDFDGGPYIADADDPEAVLYRKCCDALEVKA